MTPMKTLIALVVCAAAVAARAGRGPERAADRDAPRRGHGSQRRGDTQRRRRSEGLRSGPTVDLTLAPATTDGQGVATITGLPQGRYTISAAFPGFEARTLTDVRVRGGDNRREIELAIEKVAESVAVGRDPATAASDPKSSRFGNVLSRDQIDALPDDPDEMEKALKDMAGPGAVLRMDGFRGGRLPPKSQIRSIRFSQRNVRRRESQRRAYVHRRGHAARTRAASGRRRLVVPRRLHERPQRVPAGQGARADPPIQHEPERNAPEGPDVFLPVRRGRLSLRFGQHFRRRAGRRSARRRSGGRRIAPTSTARRPCPRRAHTLRRISSRTTATQGQLGSGDSTCRTAAYSRGRTATACSACRKGARGPIVFAESRAAASPVVEQQRVVVRGADDPRAGRVHLRRGPAGRRPEEHRNRDRRPTSTGPIAGMRSAGRSSKAAGIAATAAGTIWARTRSRAWTTSKRPAGDVHEADWQSAGRLLPVAGGGLPSGRLARAQRSHAECRRASGGASRTWTATGTSPRASDSRGRRSRAGERPSAAARGSSSIGSKPTCSSRRCGWTAFASRIWLSVIPVIPTRSPGTPPRKCFRRAGISCAGSGSADACHGQVGDSQQLSPMWASTQLQPYERLGPVPWPQHQRAARGRHSARPVGSVT